MHPNTRALVAFIAGRVVSRGDESAIFDFSAGKTLQFDAHVTPNLVDVTLKGAGASISGSSVDGRYTLYERNTSSYVDLTISGSRFRGVDRKTRESFSGEVSGPNVSLSIGSDAFAFRLT